MTPEELDAPPELEELELLLEELELVDEPELLLVELELVDEPELLLDELELEELPEEEELVELPGGSRTVDGKVLPEPHPETTAVASNTPINASSETWLLPCDD